jgi:hypothetical protein
MTSSHLVDEQVNSIPNDGCMVPLLLRLPGWVHPW